MVMQLFLQEYLTMNKVVLEVIVTLGADNATLSEAGLAWLKLESAFKMQSPRPLVSLLGCGAMGEAAYATILAALQHRKQKSLTHFQYAAMLLDPRPTMRSSASQYIGSAVDGTLGNTPVVRSATAAMEELAKVVRGTKKDGSTRSEREASAVLIKQLHAWLEVSPAHSMRALGIKTSELAAVGDAEHPSTFWQLACHPDVVLRDAAMRLFTLLASALGVERLWSGARSTLTDTRRSMSSTRLVELLLVKMNAGVLNDDAMLECLGVHGSVVQALDFDDLYEEVLLMDEEDLVAALQGAPANSDAHSDAHSIPEEVGSDGNDTVSVDWDE
jgi:hypothetical protein